MSTLAEQYGVRRGTISHLLKRAGVERREQRAISPQEVDRAVVLHCDGWSLALIGERLGFDAETIRTHLKRRGVPPR